MKFPAVVGLLFIAVVTVRCDDPTSCCITETQFKMTIGGTQLLVLPGMPPFVFNIVLEAAFDLDNDRAAMDGHMYHIGGGSHTLKIIQSWEEEKQYTILNGMCTEEPLLVKKQTKCITTADSTFLGYQVIGMNEFSTQVWGLTPADVGIVGGQAHLTVSNQTCAVIGSSFAGLFQAPEEQVPMSQNLGYSNYRSGIPNPHEWFDVPSSCRQQKLAKTKRSVFSGKGHAEKAVEVLKKSLF